VPTPHSKKKSAAAMSAPVTTKTGAPVPQAKVNWGDVASVAGPTLGGFGVGLTALGNPGAAGAVAPPLVDNTPILILGGVLLVGVLVFAMSGKR
jgi:hypothetical protein